MSSSSSSIHAASMYFLDSLSLSIYPYHQLRLAGFPDYNLCLHGAVVDKFLLVSQYFHVNVKGSIRECYLRVHSCFSRSVPCVLFVVSLFVLFGWF